MSKSWKMKWQCHVNCDALKLALDFCEILARNGKYVQVFSEGQLAMNGQSAIAFCRISDQPVRNYSLITQAEIVIVCDKQAYLPQLEFTEFAHEEAVYILNTSLPLQQIKEKWNLSHQKILAIDAAALTKEELGKEEPGICLMAVAANMMQMVNMAEFKNNMKTLLAARIKPDRVASYLKIVDLSLDGVQTS